MKKIRNIMSGVSKPDNWKEIKTVAELLSDYKGLLKCCGATYQEPLEFFAHLKKCPAADKEARTIKESKEEMYVKIRELVPKNKKKFAYVTLIMQGDKYVPGGVVLAYSLRMAETEYDTICMVSEVSDEGMDILRTTFDYVIEVPFLKFVSRKYATEHQNQMYEPILHTIYTKWSCLLLEQYEKLFFIDCDTTATKNFDDLFKLEPPCANVAAAGIFSSAKFIRYFYKHKLKYGDIIPKLLYINCLNTTGGMSANLLLRPSVIDFVKLKIMVKAMEPFHVGEGMFGVDEQSITLYYTMMGKETRFLPAGYFGAVFWRLRYGILSEDRKKIVSPPIFHYFGGEKPWVPGITAWPDITIWWGYYDALPEKVKKLLYAKYKHLVDPGKICMYCKIINDQFDKSLIGKYNLGESQKNHTFVMNGKVVCPMITKLPTF